MVLGPVNNFVDIDTAATAVMASYSYEDKDAITFVIGATSGASISNAGLRLNSLWFKSFSLAPQTILLVKLQSFSATRTGQVTTLNWKTTSEKDFSHFVVERNVDGKGYADVALVFAAGSTGENSYRYQDKTALWGKRAYYRLRMVDVDRSAAYSPVSTVHLSKESTLAVTVLPNPASGRIGVHLPTAWQGKPVRLKLYNSSGMAALEKELRNAGATATLDIGHTPAGFYILNASCDGEAAQQRILIK